MSRARTPLESTITRGKGRQGLNLFDDQVKAMHTAYRDAAKQAMERELPRPSWQHGSVAC